MQGVYIRYNRPKSKKEIREVASIAPADIIIEATSMFGNEYSGSIVDMPDGKVTFVGPDPHNDRKFYGTITKKGDKVTVA